MNYSRDIESLLDQIPAERFYIHGDRIINTGNEDEKTIVITKNGNVAPGMPDSMSPVHDVNDYYIYYEERGGHVGERIPIEAAVYRRLHARVEEVVREKRERKAFETISEILKSRINSED